MFIQQWALVCDNNDYNGHLYDAAWKSDQCVIDSPPIHHFVSI